MSVGLVKFGIDRVANAGALKSTFVDSHIYDLYSEQISAVESALSSASDAMSSLAGDLDKSLDGARGAADAGMKAWGAFLKKAKRAVDARNLLRF